MAHKKIVFVIVEGPSDDEALGLFINRIFDKNKVYIHIVHGDLTTMSGNIRNRITEAIRSYATSTHLKKDNFQEVIHIVDMDGAYIPDSCVIESLDKKPVYSVTAIHTCCPDKIRLRNKQKRKNLDILSSLSIVWGNIPYQAYYMSCNLDHVLYNKLNSSDCEKEIDAHTFAKKYRDDIQGFMTFFANPTFSVPGTYAQTWQFIKEKNHSLERYTNFELCLHKENN